MNGKKLNVIYYIMTYIAGYIRRKLTGERGGRGGGGLINIRCNRKLITPVKASGMIHRRHSRPSMADVYMHLAVC